MPAIMAHTISKVIFFRPASLLFKIKATIAAIVKAAIAPTLFILLVKSTLP